jgi:hypothetical protein
MMRVTRRNVSWCQQGASNGPNVKPEPFLALHAPYSPPLAFRWIQNGLPQASSPSSWIART